MTKQDFITFLKLKKEEAGLLTPYWAESFEGIDEHWTLYHPSLDWMEDQMDLSEDGVVIIRYHEAIYDDPKMIRMSYMDFIADHSKSISLY